MEHVLQQLYILRVTLSTKTKAIQCGYKNVTFMVTLIIDYTRIAMYNLCING